MDNLDKRMVEMTIECKCVGLDEALEKVTKLVELLRRAKAEVNELKQHGITIDSETLAQAICDKGQESQERFIPCDSENKETATQGKCCC